ncbi:SMI1/KNR4 family protein [Streptomyces sp. NPDC000410]|uniref:SMI1/KNR4 family protein n=1 Tax=Streptomyces sp. NPDC000410 TaxID=3154254 RepID=UPI00331FBCE4
MTDDLLHAWARVETWLREHRCTSALSALRPPADEEVVRSLQNAIPYPLHPHLVQWLGIHGGVPVQAAPIWPGGYVPYGVEALKGGPEYMEEMLEEFVEQRDENPEYWILDPWADPLWLPIAGTNTGESLLIDHRPGDTYGSVIEIDHESNEVTAVRWKSLGEMIRLMAESLESGSPMPYSREYALVPHLDEGPPRYLDWKLEKVLDQVAFGPGCGCVPGPCRCVSRR